MRRTAGWWTPGQLAGARQAIIAAIFSAFTLNTIFGDDGVEKTMGG